MCLHTDTLTHRHDLDKVVQPRTACCSSRNLFYFLRVDGFMVKIVSSIWSYLIFQNYRYVTSFQKKAQIIRVRYVATAFGTYSVVVIWVFDVITNSQLQVETISTQLKFDNKPDPTVKTFFLNIIYGHYRPLQAILECRFRCQSVELQTNKPCGLSSLYDRDPRELMYYLRRKSTAQISRIKKDNI